MRTIGRSKIMAVARHMLALLLLAVGCSEGPARQKEEPSVRASLSPDKSTLEFHLSENVTMKLRRIEAGKFTMGSQSLWRNEHPQHRVTLTTPFYMGIVEVTQAQWEAVMNTQPWKEERNSRPNWEGLTYSRAGADNAANYINWYDVAAFCTALSKKTGLTVRAPTEAEWEYACRAGTTTAFSFGDDPAKLGDYAWHKRNAADKDEKYAHPVGRKKPNAWGLFDMHGNVWEWCSDWYAFSYAKGDARDPKGPTAGKIARVHRGGSWGSTPEDCRAASRRWGTVPDRYGGNVGFRVVVEVGSDGK